MDSRAAKLALARKKLKDHQEKKNINQRDDTSGVIVQNELVPATYPSEHINLNNEDINNQTEDLSKCSINDNVQLVANNLNVTEVLISNKRNLELQINELTNKLTELEHNHNMTINNYNLACKKNASLENELKVLLDNYSAANEKLKLKENGLKQLDSLKCTLLEEKSNLQEQLYLAKTVITSKETENEQLHDQLSNVHKQLDVVQLQLHQMTNGSHNSTLDVKANTTQDHETLVNKSIWLEQQLSSLHQEKEEINFHYQNYVRELNEQLNSLVKRNEQLETDNEQLYKRESGLIEQLSNVEKRLQGKIRLEAIENQSNKNNKEKELEENNISLMKKLEDLNNQHKDLQRLYSESNEKINELINLKDQTVDCMHDNQNLTKLNADITSDKVAAQRATEQNKKLKQDIQGLEDAFVKMTKDKLELTEKITAEKYLSRELTIKLSEIEEKSSNLQIKLKAKDEEMIRLQTVYREIELKYEKLLEDFIHSQKDNKISEVAVETTTELIDDIDSNDKADPNSKHQLTENVTGRDSPIIAKEDAMIKLQDRFLKIMGEVADLSDEKHRLEHIILQLQNETETICEYVALYQQQRSLLKKRDEERSAQIKIFQTECNILQRQLEELTEIIVKFAEDKELSLYFEVETKQADIRKIMDLLKSLKNNSLIDPKKKSTDLKDFYPCNCCSGQLIDI